MIQWIQGVKHFVNTYRGVASRAGGMLNVAQLMKRDRHHIPCTYYLITSDWAAVPTKVGKWLRLTSQYTSFNAIAVIKGYSMGLCKDFLETLNNLQALDDGNEIDKSLQKVSLWIGYIFITGEMFNYHLNRCLYNSYRVWSRHSIGSTSNALPITWITLAGAGAFVPETVSLGDTRVHAQHKRHFETPSSTPGARGRVQLCQ